MSELQQAKNGDINAFNELFSKHEKQLKGYLYRLLTNREDVEDHYHNTFVQAFDKLDSFRGTEAQLRSWIFTIATNQVLTFLKRKKIWHEQAQDRCRDKMETVPAEEKMAYFKKARAQPHVTYEIREHIDFCFTCLGNTLPYRQQLVLILKEVHQFKVSEVAEICEMTMGQVKHALVDARATMQRIFEKKCALINKQGTCYQCTELQGILNPERDAQRDLMKLRLVQEAEGNDPEELLELRLDAIRGLNPLHANGSDLHDALMQEVKRVNEL